MPGDRAEQLVRARLECAHGKAVDAPGHQVGRADSEPSHFQVVFDRSTVHDVQYDVASRSCEFATDGELTERDVQIADDRLLARTTTVAKQRHEGENKQAEEHHHHGDGAGREED